MAVAEKIRSLNTRGGGGGVRPVKGLLLLEASVASPEPGVNFSETQYS